jgi:tetratricopeptide (TPR) repeat protein
MDLGIVGGDLQQANPQAALSYYQKKLEVSQDLSQKTSAARYARGVANAYRNIGGVYYDLSDYPRALENYIKCLTNLQEINLADPQSAIVLQSLGLAYANVALTDSKLGKIKPALEDWGKGNDIMHKLVSSTQELIAQRHSLAVITGMGGTIFMAAHKPQSAFRQFNESRALFQSLGSSFESADLMMAAACSEKMGEAAALSGEVQVAADDFHQALTAAEPMISAKPPDRNASYVAADAYSGLGDLGFKKAQQPGVTPSQRKANWVEARSWYARSLEAWRRIEHPLHSIPDTFVDVGDPALVAKKLQQCDAVLGKRSNRKAGPAD